MSASQLDSAFSAFVTWQTLLFCLGIAIFTYAIRTIVESVWKSAKANDIWNEVGVRLGPIGTGLILVFTSKTFPWPSQILGSKLAMAFYGAACGVASAYVYAAFRAWLGVAAKKGFVPAQKLMKKKGPSVEKKAEEKSDSIPVTEESPKSDDPTPPGGTKA
jgi:hypothetical protein